MDALSSAVDSSLNAFEATGSFVFFKGEHLDELQEALAQFLGFLRKEMVPSYPELEPFLRRRAQGSGAGVPWWSSVGSSANDLLTSALLEGVAEESCRQSLQASYSFTAAFAEDKGDTAMDGGSSRRRLLAAGGGSSGGSGRSRVSAYAPWHDIHFHDPTAGTRRKSPAFKLSHHHCLHISISLCSTCHCCLRLIKHSWSWLNCRTLEYFLPGLSTFLLGGLQGKGGNAERAMDSSQWKDKEILQTNAAVAAGGLNQEVPRYVGNANNRLVAGVLLHQTRRPPRVLPYMCSAHEERFHGLTKMCTTMEIVLANLPVRVDPATLSQLKTVKPGVIRDMHAVTSESHYMSTSNSSKAVYCGIIPVIPRACTQVMFPRDQVVTPTVASQEGEVMRYAEDFAHPLAPYGSDPVLRPASALFSAAARADDYYNMSRESGEVSGYGAARWFFPRQVAGLADGFPLVLETRMSRRRASEVTSHPSVHPYTPISRAPSWSSGSAALLSPLPGAAGVPTQLPCALRRGTG